MVKSTSTTEKIKKPYSREFGNVEKMAKAKVNDTRCHFKNTRETAGVLRGMKLEEAKKYLKDVLAHKRCVPFRRFTGGIGRCAQAKEWKCSLGRWPKKSVEAIQGVLKNAEANAEVKTTVDTSKLRIWHIQVNKAQKQRRRTYRAHGRINPFMCSPCHIEIILAQDDDEVKPPEEMKE